MVTLSLFVRLFQLLWFFFSVCVSFVVFSAYLLYVSAVSFRYVLAFIAALCFISSGEVIFRFQGRNVRFYCCINLDCRNLKPVDSLMIRIIIWKSNNTLLISIIIHFICSGFQKTSKNVLIAIFPQLTHD